MGQDTRFSSIQLGSTDVKSGGHGPGLSLAWDQRGKPVAGLNTPLEVYHRLFSVDDMPLKKRRALIAQERSVLDAVREEARRALRIDEDGHREAGRVLPDIRDIETRIAKEEQWLEVPKAKPPIDEPKSGLKGKKRSRSCTT